MSALQCACRLVCDHTSLTSLSNGQTRKSIHTYDRLEKNPAQTELAKAANQGMDDRNVVGERNKNNREKTAGRFLTHSSSFGRPGMSLKMGCLMTITNGAVHSPLFVLSV